MDEGASSVRDHDAFPIVALGSSAGGLEALEEFFQNVSPDSDMAYVVISHLEPHHTSLMAEIISKSSAIEAAQAENGMEVEKNKIYVIPPGKYMTIERGELRLLPRESEPFMPIDHFLRSLAMYARENAAAIILSGNRSDGTVGLRSVHAELGVTMAQSPETARYDSMPRSAIDTGLVDYIMHPSEMPEALSNHFQALRANALPPRTEPVGGTDDTQNILSIVKRETGHDFSLYKKSTINRRIERRMTVHQLESKKHYANYLLQNPKEIHLLFQELIIDVTSFFRNPAAFDSLKEALRQAYFASGPKKEDLRVWVTACSTGEEAYSIAIVLKELMGEAGQNKRVHIFGSDINEEAIQVARQGDFPPTIADDMDGKRLETYFTRHENGYKIKKEIREMIIFAPHDHIRDPPFLHLDLVSCRNLLIYFEPSLQRRLLDTFSVALNSNGILFLGESETIQGYDDLFTAIDPKWKIYRRRPYSAPLSYRYHGMQPQRRMGPYVPKTRLATGPNIKEKAEKVLLTDHTPPALIVNERNEVIFFHGRNRQYLEHVPGKASLQIQDLLVKDLRYTVISALDEARNAGKSVCKEGVQVRTNGDASFLNIIIEPLADGGPSPNVLVIFDEKVVPKRILVDEPKLAIGPNEEERMDELEKELIHTKESLRRTILELENSNEELRSANEELQSNNEELQSVVEESETGKEELNSLNEELAIVNSELERRNQELAMTSSDMRNLLYSIEEALIFLDINLNIRRFTPQMKRIMNLLPSDVGRSIEDITVNLQYGDLVPEARNVLDTLNTKEREVQTKDDHWYRLKIIPYRTVDNVIDGVVATFIDIDAQKKTQDKLRELSAEARISQEFAESVVNTVKEPLIVLERDMVVRVANTTFYTLFETRPEDIRGRPLFEVMDGMWNIPELIDRLTALSQKEYDLENLKVKILIPHLGERPVELTARKLLTPSGQSSMMLMNIEVQR